MRDATFRSAALGREMQFRVILPLSVPEGQKLPVVYLLHGGGGGFRDWSNYSEVARFAEGGLVLVMPEGGGRTTRMPPTAPRTGMKITF